MEGLLPGQAFQPRSDNAGVEGVPGASRVEHFHVARSDREFGVIRASGQGSVRTTFDNPPPARTLLQGSRGVPRAVLAGEGQCLRFVRREDTYPWKQREDFLFRRRWPAIRIPPGIEERLTASRADLLKESRCQELPRSVGSPQRTDPSMRLSPMSGLPNP
jgi:hypothetical protein